MPGTQPGNTPIFIHSLLHSEFINYCTFVSFYVGVSKSERNEEACQGVVDSKNCSHHPELDPGLCNLYYRVSLPINKHFI